jgi:hypothetical protein
VVCARMCLGLRGEEIPLIEFAGTAESLQELQRAGEYFAAVISGHTKGNQISGSKFRVPCVVRTEGTDLRPGTWIKRLVFVKTEMGNTGGRLLQRKLKPARRFEFEDDWFTVLERVQAKTDLIEDKVGVRDSYGILRSLRKGNAAHALNMGVPTTLINSYNRWRKSMEAGTRVPTLDMLDLYFVMGGHFANSLEVHTVSLRYLALQPAEYSRRWGDGGDLECI